MYGSDQAAMEWPVESFHVGELVLDMRPESNPAWINEDVIEKGDFWQRHLMWAIPAAAIMTILYWPFFTRLEKCKISMVVTTSILISTISAFWPLEIDTHIVESSSDQPLHQIAFFAALAYNTALVYTMLTKRLVLPVFLTRTRGAKGSLLGQLIIVSLFSYSIWSLQEWGRSARIGLILAWACPALMLEWSLCSRFLLALPRGIILRSIGIPSIFLSIANLWASHKDIGNLGDPMKQSDHIYLSTRSCFDIEQIAFFWIINIVVVFSLVAFDHAVAITEWHIVRVSGETQAQPPLRKLIRVYISERRRSHEKVIFLQGLSEAVEMVSKKSQSMYMGSAMFQGGLRIDLLVFYYFCRVMDDLVDEAPNPKAAELAIRQCSWALKCHFGKPNCELDNVPSHPVYGYVEALFHAPAPNASASPALTSAITLLPARRLSLFPLLGLIDGFSTDLKFSPPRGDDAAPASSPIATERDLNAYAYNVASVVAVSIVHLIYRHYPPPRTPRPHAGAAKEAAWLAERRERIVEAAEAMGQALQYVNIARDVERDAAIGRVYLPLSWLRGEGLEVADVIRSPHDARVTKLRMRLLDMADELYSSNEALMDELPEEARAAVRAVVESYMAIGQEVRRTPRGRGKEKLKLSPWRRLWVVWRAMCFR